MYFSATMPLITLLKSGSLVKNWEGSPDISEIIPVEYIIGWFRGRLDKTGIINRILVLRSDTGSGKSTAFPVYLYKELFTKNAGGIAVTQPRIINAITIVRDQIAGSTYYPFMKLGENIGWLTGSNKKRSQYGLTYMTLGTLLEQMRTLTDQQLISKYRFIIIDEVHEASQEQAILLYMLKNFMERNAENPGLPFLVLTSATFDVYKFLKYYGVFSEPSQPNLIQVSGFVYPLETRWTIDIPANNYMDTLVNTVIDIHRNNLDDPEDNRDILAFVPSMGEITKITKKLNIIRDELAKTGYPIFIVLNIDGETVRKNKDDFVKLTKDLESLSVKISSKIHKVFRRVILSTIVAETGITIDTLKYVVDSGMGKGPEYNPHLNASGIISQPIAKSRIRQRMGRANRKSAGVFYPLYPKSIYDKLPDNQLAEVELSDTGPIILSLIMQETVQIDTVADSAEFPIDLTLKLDVIDPIPEDCMSTNIEKLYLLGFLSPISDYMYKQNKENDVMDLLENIKSSKVDKTRFGITRMGAISAYFSHIPPEFLRTIFAGYAWNIKILDLITICSYLSVPAEHFADKRDQPINWSEIYKEALPPHITEELSDVELIARVRLLISDDFVDGLLLFAAISRIIGKHSADMLTKTKQFCKKSNINYKTMMEFIKIRDGLIEQFLTFGFDVTIGKSLLNADKIIFADIITGIKYCIYDGFRNNIAVKQNNIYRVIGNIAIDIPEMLASAVVNKTGGNGNENDKLLPKYIVYDSLRFSRVSAESGMFELSAHRISVLDGYVKNDLNFSYLHEIQ